MNEWFGDCVLRRNAIFFLISTLILVGILIARQMGWMADVTGFVADAKAARAHEELLLIPVCEDPVAFKSIRKFDVLRAYPKRAIRNEVEGRVFAMLRVDDAGKVRDVMVTKSQPAGVFGKAVEREALKMTYEPAEPACRGKIREAELNVEFKLED